MRNKRKMSWAAVYLTMNCLLGARVIAQQPASAAAPPASTTPTIDQSLEMKSASNPEISPDGKRVVYELSRTNWEDNAFERDLWIVDTATGEGHQLTASKKSSTNAAWSPDGKWIAFLSDRPGQISGTPESKKQIYVIAADGGEARQLTKVEAGVNSLAWSPDSKKLAFSAEDPEPKTMKDRKEKYGEYDVVHADYKMVHLWTLEIPAGETAAIPEPKRLTEGALFSVDELAWSPDATRLAFSAQRDPDLISSETADIYVAAVSDGKVKKIVSTPGPDRNPKWSPDGKQIAYETSAASKYFFYTNKKIAVVEADGGTPRVLTDTFDEDPGLIEWAADGIYFAAEQKTYAHLFRLNPDTKVVAKLSSPEHFFFKGLQTGGLQVRSGKRIYGDIRDERCALASEETHVARRPAEGIQDCKARSYFLEVGRRGHDRRRSLLAGGLQAWEKISTAGCDSWRTNRRRSADSECGPVLPAGTICSERRADSPAELQRISGIR
jgi:hypothetical protein